MKDIKKIKSCIKWTGGKYSEIDVILNNLPSDFKTYVEPFVGGGATFWTISNNYMCDNYHINDLNEELINFYTILKFKYNELINEIQTHNHSKKYFNLIRDRYNNKRYRNNVERASIFYYLNKTSFSGKWRVNRNNKYNNSWGDYKNTTWKNINPNYSKLLSNCKITNDNAINVMEQYNNDDCFIFLDPPYYNSDSMYLSSDDMDLDTIYSNILQYYKHTKSKVLMIVGRTDELEIMFKDYIVGGYINKYSHNAKSNSMAKHLIVRNY